MNTSHHNTIQRIAVAQPQPFSLLMTTSHPDSAEECAGEVVLVPAEFAERTVLIDLNQVTRIDSWGLAIFIEAMQRITACGGNLVLIRIHEDVRRVLEAVKLDQVFRICADREEALALHSAGLHGVAGLDLFCGTGGHDEGPAPRAQPARRLRDLH